MSSRWRFLLRALLLAFGFVSLSDAILLKPLVDTAIFKRLKFAYSGESGVQSRLMLTRKGNILEALGALSRFPSYMKIDELIGVSGYRTEAGEGGSLLRAIPNRCPPSSSLSEAPRSFMSSAGKLFPSHTDLVHRTDLYCRWHLCLWRLSCQVCQLTEILEGSHSCSR